ncbi:MAG: tyrosine-type recombinase/integrase [Idiomarinaceae bacterium]|uniref:tyrosine-type recombinase/integrase n=1 Tax=Idiomarina sp. 28-8 TaxID=1260624 RepID=UPI00030BCD3F|nr:tyrosine-type recombinase/integrase [Idiomarina sp. 28-8]NWO03114.1 tyrosine-type recombinase/integrase [Idiomarinaceae bacterium]
MKATQYTGIYAGKNAVRMEFIYRHQRCRETIHVRPTESNLRRLRDHLEEVRMAIKIGKFDYFEYFPESKNALQFSDKKAAHITIEQMMTRWYEQSYKNWAFSTEKANRGRMDNHVIPNFGKIIVDDFTPSRFREWQRTATVSAKTVNEVHSLLSQAFDFLVYDDIIDQNPMKRVRRLKHQTKEVQPFTPEEREKILLALPEGYARDFYEFAFWTGLRTGEQIGLRWENVDLERKVIFIRESIVKGRRAGTKTKGSNRTHELNQKALKVLDRVIGYGRQKGYVFLDPRFLSRWVNDGVPRERFWTKAVKKANVRYLRPYCCRHTYASTMLSDGKHPMWVAQQLGHKDWGMIRKIYGRWLKDATNHNG